MLAGLAQLEFDILGLDSWWIGLTDQGHEGRCWSHPFNFILTFLILVDPLTEQCYDGISSNFDKVCLVSVNVSNPTRVFFLTFILLYH